MPPAWPLHAPVNDTAARIERINSLPDDQLRFADFRLLKSGRDRFSAMSLDQLREMVGQATEEAISTALDNDQARAVAMRWRLRGLAVDRAVRKAETDQEINRCAIEGPCMDGGVTAAVYNRALAEWLAVAV